MAKIYTEIRKDMARICADRMVSQDASKIGTSVSGTDPKKIDRFVLDRNHCEYQWKAPLFFTNENDSYMKNLNRGNSAMIIAGGGDNIIDLVSCGYKRILAIDVNPLQLFVTILKIQSVIALDYTSFLNFWNAHSSSCFSFEVIRRILTQSEEPLFKIVLEFWEWVFNHYNFDATLVRYYCIMAESNFINHKSKRNLLCDYAKVIKGYKKARAALSKDVNIELVCENVFDYIPHERFDLIHLSNIFNFTDPRLYVEVASKLVESNLNEGGKLTTYIIQLKEDWFKVDNPIIDESDIKSHPIALEALNQHVYQAHGVYHGLRANGYSVNLVPVNTGHGYSAFYNTIKDVVLIVSK